MNLPARISLTLTAVAAALSAQAQLTIPNEFTAGEPARAAEVNRNFATLAQGINANAAAIAELDDALSATAGQLAASVGSVAVVAATGGDYMNPLDAVANISAGDAWCRGPEDDPAQFPCVISIAPGNYLLAATLEIPAGISLVGYGPRATILRAADGVRVAVRTAEQPAGGGTAPDLGSVIRSLAIDNPAGDGALSIALETPDEIGLVVSDVTMSASGAGSNTGIRSVYREYHSGPSNRFDNIRVFVSGGETSTGLSIENSARPRVSDCEILVTDAAANRGVHADSGQLMLERCEITARGGQRAVAVAALGQSTSNGPFVTIAGGTLVAEDASDSARGLDSRFTYDVSVNDVDISARRAAEVTGVWISLDPPFETGVLRDLRISASEGSTNVGLHSEGGHWDIYSLRLADSNVTASSTSGGAVSYGIRLGVGSEGNRLLVTDSTVSGASAPVFNAGPNEEWDSAFGPPLLFTILQSRLNGPLVVNGHYARCQFVFDANTFYEDTCPAGSDNRTLP